MDIKAEIDAGVCGFYSIVNARSADGVHVQLELESACPRVQALAAELPDLDAIEEVLRKPLTETTPALLAARHSLHATCPVPIGILKAIEAAAGLALPQQCEVTLSGIE
jgi:hypothetical protein